MRIYLYKSNAAYEENDWYDYIDDGEEEEEEEEDEDGEQ